MCEQTVYSTFDLLDHHTTISVGGIRVFISVIYDKYGYLSNIRSLITPDIKMILTSWASVNTSDYSDLLKVWCSN